CSSKRVQYPIDITVMTPHHQQAVTSATVFWRSVRHLVASRRSVHDDGSSNADILTNEPPQIVPHRLQPEGSSMHQTAQQPDHQHDSHTGHEQHDHAHHVDQFRRLFWVMVVLGIPVVVFNPMFADLLGYSLPDSTWVWWISPILGSIIYF